MGNYHVKFRVHYVGGTTDEFDVNSMTTRVARSTT